MKTIIIYLSIILSLGQTSKIRSFANPVEELTAKEVKIFEDQIEKALKELLDPYDPLYVPFIPTQTIKIKDDIYISISFANVSLTGLEQSLKVTNFDIPGLFNKYLDAEVIFSNITVYAAEYSAGGHVQNIPFTGESFAKFSFEDFRVRFKVKSKTGSLSCFKEGTSSYEIDVRKPTIYFDNIDPGTDQGILINDMLTSAIPQILKFFQSKLNGEWHSTIDPFVVEKINEVRCYD